MKNLSCPIFSLVKKESDVSALFHACSFDHHHYSSQVGLRMAKSSAVGQYLFFKLKSSKWQFEAHTVPDRCQLMAHELQSTQEKNIRKENIKLFKMYSSCVFLKECICVHWCT